MRRFDPHEHARNVLGEKLQSCSERPKTGFFRDGCCNTSPEDVGVHTVCAVMTAEFLEYSKAQGNDLTTPFPQAGFPGLAAGRPLVPVRAAVARGARCRARAARGARCDARGVAGVRLACRFQETRNRSVLRSMR